MSGFSRGFPTNPTPRPDTIAFVERVLIHVFKQRTSRKMIASVATKIERVLPVPRPLTDHD